MKILLILFILFSTNVYGWGFFGGDEEDQPQQEVKEVIVEKPVEFCHSYIRVTPDEPGLNVLYVFKHVCGEISQVGLIEEREKKIYLIKDAKKIDGGYDYKRPDNTTNLERKKEIILREFPDLTPLEIYRN